MDKDILVLDEGVVFIYREDLNAVYQLVMDKNQGEIPEGFDKVLWGDLMVMFNPDDEDEFWNSQQDWNIVVGSYMVLQGVLNSLVFVVKSRLGIDQSSCIGSPKANVILIRAKDTGKGNQIREWLVRFAKTIKPTSWIIAEKLVAVLLKDEVAVGGRIEFK
ncbi:hypothetical protein Tco_0292283 [Tanacetum coccineum]